MSIGTPGGLFIVRRAFKAHGILYNIGEIIEDPTVIKLYRSRLADRDIIELLDGGIENPSWFDYLTARTTMTLDPLIYKICNIPLPVLQEEIPKVASKEPLQKVKPIIK